MVIGIEFRTTSASNSGPPAVVVRKPHANHVSKAKPGRPKEKKEEGKKPKK
jgi:hypothetical protein